MKKTKRILSFFLSLTIICGIITIAPISVNASDYKTSFIKAFAKKGKFWNGTNGGTFCFMDLNSDNNPELVFTYYYSSNAATEIYRYLNGSITRCYVGNSTSDYNTCITGIFNYYYNSTSNQYLVFGYERTYNSTSSYYRDYEISISGSRVYKNYHSPWSSLKSINITKKTISSESWLKYSEAQKETALTQSYNAFGYSNSPTSVKLNRSTLGLGVGENYGLVKTVSPSNANQNVTWSSSNSSIATVDKNGKVVGKKSGKATVTVKTSNGKTASCTVTVKSAPSSVKTNPASLKLGIGESYTVSECTNSGSYANAANLRWTSSNTSAATVVKTAGTNKAVVTAKSKGSSNISIKTYNGKTASCALTVYPAPSSVKLSATNITLKKGQTYTISESSPSGTYANSANLKWTSSNTKIATVTKGSANKATIKALSSGTSTIRISLFNGKTATCKVTVK